MKKIHLLLLVVLMGVMTNSNAQVDCILGVGITNDSIIADVFQLNKEQNKSLINYAAELKYRNELLNTRLDNFQKRQPQSTVEELIVLAKEYREVMDSMKLVQAMVDKRMLALFNENQYKLYLSLCNEAALSPYRIIPKVYSDSIKAQNRK